MWAGLVVLALLIMPSAKAGAENGAAAPAAQPTGAIALDALNTPPQGFDGATVIYKPNARVPLDLVFVDEAGKTVKLGDYFQGKPVILAMVYYNCPSVCGITLGNLLQGVRSLNSTLKLGKDYEIVTVSFNPRETPEMATLKKAAYITALGDAEAAPGWHFLTTTSEANARALGDAIGFGYKYNAVTDQYLHQSAVHICMPDGRVSRVITGGIFETEELRDSLTNASEGKLASPIFRTALSCGLYGYDAATGRYVLVAKNMMRLGGLLTVLILGGFLGTFWYHDARKRRHQPPLAQEGTA